MLRQEERAAPIKVLIADDDPIFTAIGSAALSGLGCHVTVANDGGEALHALVHGEFQLAIVDLSMPEIDGFRLIALVRSTPHLARLPIMVVTVHDEAEAIEEAHRLGANSYTCKPVDWRRLGEQVRSIAARS